MGKLIKAECLKLSKLRSYKIFLLCAAAMGLMMGCTLMYIPAEDLPAVYSGQDGYSIYMSVASDIEVFTPLPFIFAILFVCPEFSNRTFSISLFSGCSRRNMILAKAIIFLVGLIPIIFVVPLVAGIAGSIITGFGHADVQMWGALVQTTLLAALGHVSVGGFFFMMAVLIKNTVGTIGAGIGLLFGAELLRAFSVFVYPIEESFLYQTMSLLQLESVGTFIAVTVASLVITLGVSIASFQRAELK